MVNISFSKSLSNNQNGEIRYACTLVFYFYNINLTSLLRFFTMNISYLDISSSYLRMANPIYLGFMIPFKVSQNETLYIFRTSTEFVLFYFDMPTQNIVENLSSRKKIQNCWENLSSKQSFV